MISNMNIPANKVSRIMRAFPLVSNPFRHMWYHLSRKQMDANGMKWTSDRMKALVAYFIQLRGSLSSSDDEDIMKVKVESNRPSWWKICTLSYPTKVTLVGSDEQFTQMIQVLQIYTYFFKDTKTLEIDEYISFTNGLNRSYEFGPKLLSEFAYVYGQTSRMWWKVSKSFIKLSSHAYPIDPVLFRQSEYEKAELAMSYVQEFCGGLPHYFVRRNDFVVEKILGLDVLPRSPEKKANIVTYNSNASSNLQESFKLNEPISTWPFGYVHYRRQVNGKVRWFLAAEQWQNEIFHRYTNNMYDRLKAIPEDYTHNQDAGVIQVQEWIKQGKTCHSIDLSSATDSFPWYATKRIIGFLSHFRKTWMTFLDLYEKLVIMPGARIAEEVEGEDQFVKWRVGQPLGSQPSFAMFALSHHFVVRLAFNARKIPFHNNYVILGDDVVINDSTVATEYRRLINILKISVSESKSVASPRIAEFAGRIIQRDAFGFKYKAQKILPENLQSAISVLGPRAIRACRPGFHRDIIALIPFRGYNGTNPGGFPKPFVDEFLQWLFARPEMDNVNREWDLYANPSTVAARAGIVKERHKDTLANLSKDKYFSVLHDNSNVSWKWKPFMQRRTYNLIIKVARTIWERHHTPRGD